MCHCEDLELTFFGSINDEVRKLLGLHLAAILIKATGHQRIRQNTRRRGFDPGHKALTQSLNLTFVIDRSFFKFTLSLVMPVQGHDRFNGLERYAF